MFFQHIYLMAKEFGRAESVPDVGVLRYDFKHQLLARPANHQRRARLLQRLRLAVCVFQLIIATLERDRLFSPQTPDDFGCFVNAIDSLGYRPEMNSISRVLKLEPACAYAHYQTASARVIERRAHLCKQSRMAIGVACNKYAHLRKRSL